MARPLGSKMLTSKVAASGFVISGRSFNSRLVLVLPDASVAGISRSLRFITTIRSTRPRARRCCWDARRPRDGAWRWTGGRRHAPLGQPVERPLRGASHRALGARREQRERGQGLGAVGVGERAERVVQGVLGEAAEPLGVEGGHGHPKVSPKNGCCGWSWKWALRAYSSTAT